MSEELVQKLKDLGKSHLKAMSKDLINEIVFAALKEAVKKSQSPVDDMVLEALEKPLKEAALEMIEKI